MRRQWLLVLRLRKMLDVNVQVCMQGEITFALQYLLIKFWALSLYVRQIGLYLSTLLGGSFSVIVMSTSKSGRRPKSSWCRWKTFMCFSINCLAWVAWSLCRWSVMKHLRSASLVFGMNEAAPLCSNDDMVLEEWMTLLAGIW